MKDQQVTIFGERAKTVKDGEIFIARTGSIEGRIVVTLTSIKEPDEKSPPVKVQCSLCPQWWYLTDTSIEASKTAHEEYHARLTFKDGKLRNNVIGKVEWLVIG